MARGRTRFSPKRAAPAERKLEAPINLKHYLDGTGKHRLLTAEEEYALGRLARRGDKKAQQILVVSNLGFVVGIAKKFSATNPQIRLEDLIQEGNIGLLKAAKAYDPRRKKFRFCTYAIWWIRAYIMRHIVENRNLVRGGGVGFDRVKRPLDASLDAPVNEENGDSTSFLDFVESGLDDPEVAQRRKEIEAQIFKIANRLKKRIGPIGFAILTDRFRADSPQTLAEIGARFQVSRERVRQIEKKVRELLQPRLEDLFKP